MSLRTIAAAFQGVWPHDQNLLYGPCEVHSQRPLKTSRPLL